MPRNKYPEETVKRILEVSLNLFLEKGYEKTSIQDIIDHLGGLSKGAIYHHFKSKDDIMMAVMDRLYGDHDADWMKTVKDSGKTGAQKLQELFRKSVFSPKQSDVFATAMDMTNSPKMLAVMIRSIIEDSAPNVLRPIIEQGVADGSLHTDYPGELAEMLLLLVNLWLLPMVSYADPPVMTNRLALFQQVLVGIGMQPLDSEIVDQFLSLCQLYAERRRSTT